MTTIDAGTHVGCYLLQELGGTVYEPLKDPHWKPGMVGASALMSFSLIDDLATLWSLQSVAGQRPFYSEWGRGDMPGQPSSP